MELHEVGGPADAHGCTRDDTDDVAVAHQFFFEEALFGDGGETIDFANVGNVARQDAPDERHAAARFRDGGKCDDRHERPIARNETRGESAVGKNGDQFHVQFAGSVADEFGYGFSDF